MCEARRKASFEDTEGFGRVLGENGDMAVEGQLVRPGWDEKATGAGKSGGGLTRVCKIEIIATNRPHRPWIPAYAGMTEWAR